MITVLTLKLESEQFSLEGIREAVKEWLYGSDIKRPDIKFYKLDDIDNEVSQFNSDDTLFVIPYELSDTNSVVQSPQNKLNEIRSNVNKQDCWLRTPLHWACEYKNIEMAEFLLKNGANINAVQEDNWTALHFACEEDDYLMVQLLIKNGAELMVVNDDKFTPLHITVYSNNDIITNFLLSILSNKVRTNQVLNINNNTWQDLLCVVAQYGKAHAVQLMLVCNIDPNIFGSDGYTAMHYASIRGWTDVVKILLEFNAHVNPITINGRTPLQLANHFENNDVQELLLQNGAV